MGAVSYGAIVANSFVTQKTILEYEGDTGFVFFALVVGSEVEWSHTTFFPCNSLVHSFCDLSIIVKPSSFNF